MESFMRTNAHIMNTSHSNENYVKKENLKEHECMYHEKMPLNVSLCYFF